MKTSKPVAQYQDPKRHLAQWRQEFAASRAEARAAWNELRSVVRGEHLTPEQRAQWEAQKAGLKQAAAGLRAELAGFGRHVLQMLQRPVALVFLVLLAWALIKPLF